MKPIRALFLTLCLMVAASGAGLAQDDTAEDAGFLERQIQNLLGGEGRDVRISGLSGVLSSEATIDRIQIADDDGVWLTVTDVALNWRRLALLRRRLEVEALNIGTIDLVRPPLPAPGEPPALAADTTAEPFSLPELPLAVNVQQLSVGALSLGEALIGQEAILSINGSAGLEGGTGNVDLSVARIDGHDSSYRVAAGFDNATRDTLIDVLLREAEGGLIGTVSGIPGAPSLELTVAGDAPLSDFTADIDFQTDAVERLAGAVRISDTPDGPGERQIEADLGGDVAALFLPDYQSFFGRRVALTLVAQQGTEYGLSLDDFALTTQGLNLGGTARLNTAFLPESVDITGRLGTASGLPVVLPLSGPPLLVHGADLAIQYDEAQGDTFTLDLLADGVMRADGLLIDQLALNADGTLEKAGPTDVTAVRADIATELVGFSTTDPALWDAVGDELDAVARVDWERGGALRVSGLDVTGGNVTAAGAAVITGLEEGTIALDTDLTASAADLSRFSAISGQTLGGALEAEVEATYTVNSGAFDVTLTGQSRDLVIGEPSADGLLAGTVDLNVAASRGADGIALDRLRLDGEQIDIEGMASLAPDGLPRNVTLTGRIGTTSGAPVVLPVPDADMTLQRADLDVFYDAAQGDTFRLDLVAQDFNQAGTIAVGNAAITGNGTLARTDAGIDSVTAQVLSEVTGVVLPVPDMSTALEDGATLSANLDWQAADDLLTLSALDLSSGAARLQGNGTVATLAAGTPAADFEVTLASGPLSRFAALAGQDLGGSVAGDLSGAYDTATGFFNVDADVTGDALRVGIDEVDDFIAGTTSIATTASRDAGGITVSQLRLDGERIDLEGMASLDPDNLPRSVTLTGRVASADGTPVVLPVPDAGMTLQQADLDVFYDAAEGDAFRIDIVAQDFDQPGTVTVGNAAIRANGSLERAAAELRAVTAQIVADVSEMALPDAQASAALADGAVLTANLDWTAEEDLLTLTALDVEAGPARVRGSGTVTAMAAGAPAADFDLQVATGPLGRFATLVGQNLGGSVSGDVSAAYDTATGFFDVDADVTGEALRVGIPDVDQILVGTSQIIARAARDADGLRVDRIEVDTAELDLLAQGGVDPAGAARVDVVGGLRNVGLFLPGFNEPLSLAATLTSPDQQTWSVDGTLDGPVGMAANYSGIVLQPDGTLDLDATANIPLILGNIFIAPRTVEGTARLNLSVNGEPGLDAVSGQVTVSGGRLSDPATRLALENIAASIGMQQGRANIDVTSNLSTGGQITVNGPVTLSGDFPAQIDVALRQLRLVDPTLYEVNLGGDISVAGPLLGGAEIGGRIDIGRSEIDIGGSFGGGGTVIDVRHVGEFAASRMTREFAGLIDLSESGGGGGGGPAFPLDILISAPNEIFIRGRGLNVEMGGQILVRGTTANPLPDGEFRLIRGRLDLLGRQLSFNEATISLQGDFAPDLRMIAQSENGGVTSFILIEGPLTTPEITFESSPELPEDEVLAQLFFGKPLQDLTPLEVAQLAGAIRRLTGGGGGGPLGFARETLGVDQLSVGSDEEGNTSVTAGRYITEDIYTDVTVDEEGRSEVQLNYELRQGLTVRGGFTSDGDTGIGFAYEFDY